MATRQEVIDQLKSLGYVAIRHGGQHTAFAVPHRKDMRIIAMVHTIKVEQHSKHIGRWLIIATGRYGAGSAEPCKSVGGSQRIRIGAMLFDCKGEVQL